MCEPTRMCTSEAVVCVRMHVCGFALCTIEEPAEYIHTTFLDISLRLYGYLFHHIIPFSSAFVRVFPNTATEREREEEKTSNPTTNVCSCTRTHSRAYTDTATKAPRFQYLFKRSRHIQLEPANSATQIYLWYKSSVLFALKFTKESGEEEKKREIGGASCYVSTQYWSLSK